MTPREHAIAVLEFARAYTNNLLSGIPEDRYTFQPSPTDNHVLWVMGHLAGTDMWFGSLLGIGDMPTSDVVQKAFGMGSKPGTADNPSVAEVKDHFVRTRAALLAWFKSAPDSALAMDLSAKTQGFTSDPIDAMLKTAWHEGFHSGQIANVRKAMGLPPTI